MDLAYDGISASDQTRNMDLEKFLSRPVRIATFTWNETDAVGTSRTYNPWNLFFTDARVKYKLNNFAFIQCKLKIKVLINASPFYYGAMYCGYQPLPTFCPSTIINDAGTRYFIPYSQRPHVWLNPQHNEGAEMTLPYFNAANWINAQSAQAMTDMGQLTFLNYTTLQSANGVTGSGVSVAIYAWAEDVKLSGPSVGLAVQSDAFTTQSDEYGEGVISAPASAIANGARWFEDIPIIGRFATATRIGASAISSIASMFGFTNVPVIADTMPVRTEAFPKFASSEIGYPVEKLTLDPKNELSIDPSIVGLTGEDELAIAHLVQKESYLTSTTWTTSNAVDDILFTSTVSPAIFDTDAATQAKYYMTPMSWVAALFEHWRGDVIFKFKIVASPFHKGRLRISFDPAGYTGENLTTDATSSNVVFTEIVDLGTTNEVEFRIPYQQATAFLAVPNISVKTWSTSTSPSFLYNPVTNNGTITVRVQTALTAPVGTSSLSVLVFVRGAENMEFANPTNVPSLSTWAVQSDVVSTMGTDTPQFIKERYLVNFGECVKSVRQVLRRTSLVSVSTYATDVTNDWCILKKNFYKIPGSYGYDPNGINSAKGLVVTGSNFGFNYTQPNPLHWILPAFVAFRGSTIWTFNVDAPTPVGHVRCQRINNNVSIVSGETLTVATKGTRSADAAFFYQNLYQGSAGQAMTNQNTQAGLSVLCPMFNQYRFASTNPAWYTNASLTDGSQLDQLQLEILCDGSTGVTDKGLRLWSYVGAGTDFSPHFFLNVPTYTKYSATPTAN